MVAAMYLCVIVMGVLIGVIASYLTLIIWNRYLSRYFPRKTITNTSEKNSWPSKKGPSITVNPLSIC